MDRRGFLGSILAMGAAPAIVRADSLMRIVVPTMPQVVAFGSGNSLLTPELIARDALHILRGHLQFSAALNSEWDFRCGRMADSIVLRRTAHV